MYLSFINTGASTDFSRHEAKNQNLPRLHRIFFLMAVFVFPSFFAFSNIKFDQNFVTKKPKQKNRNLVSSNIWQQMPPEFVLPNEATRVRKPKVFQN